jgi:hypothetical protein
LTRIDIEDAIAAGIKSYKKGDGHFVMTNVHGIIITIKDRDAKIISDAINAQFHITAPVHEPRLVESWKSKSRPFLNGTSCYKVI